MNPGLRDKDIGVCFISPCPAKVSYVKNGFMGKKSYVDLVVSMNDVYFALLPLMKKDKTPMPISHSGMIGISWASAGGEASALFNDRYLAADGIENVIRVLDQIENGNMPSLEFIELNACSAGCVGGTMAVENPYIAKTRLQTLRRYLPVTQNWSYKEKNADTFVPEEYFSGDRLKYQPITLLDNEDVYKRQVWIRISGSIIDAPRIRSSSFCSHFSRSRQSGHLPLRVSKASDTGMV